MLGTLFAMAVLGDARTMDARQTDWRVGAIVYQVFVDRFAPPADLDAKRKILTAPRRVRTWNEKPVPGRRLPEYGVWSHELDFWGGDLASLRTRLEHVQKLGADVLYLQPIHAAFTNHKYDAQDYLAISPEIGTRDELRSLIRDVHGRGMKIILDGVFNHAGRTSRIFQEAQKDPKSPYRDWFFFGPDYPLGYRAWVNVPNLPALRLENPEVREFLWNGKDSVVRQYLRDGIDGWRLDVAFELGPEFLSELTRAAHATRKGSAVVGEINGYPADWFPAVDGVFNFHAMMLARDLLDGKIEGGRAGRMLRDLVDDAGIENLLRSWIVLDNHDTPRAATVLPDPVKRQFAQALQFTLPGCPVIYYGTELGMAGGDDPRNRAPMAWELATDDNPDLAWMRKLVAARKRLPALRHGDFRLLETDQLLGFVRLTDKFRETALVVANPTGKPVTETFAVRVGKLMSWGEVQDVLTGERARSVTGLLTVTVPPRTVRVFTPLTEPVDGHSPYRRIG